MGEDWREIFEDMERKALRDAIKLGCVVAAFTIVLLLVNGI